MQNTYLNVKTLQKVINFRRDIHQHAQIGFQQKQTRQKIRKILKQFGVQQQQMKDVNQQTKGKEVLGLIVNISGWAPPSGQSKCIAFRADMDGLPMQQNNPHLKYKSVNKKACHSCGHDGHIACLVGFVAHLMESLNKIPSNKIIRLIFQSSEQGPQPGAPKLIEKGCLQGVKQIYGLHNLPIPGFGRVWCKEGPVMSESTYVRIEIRGKGAHGSQPQKALESVRGAVKFYSRSMEYLDGIRKLKGAQKFTFSFPFFQGGDRYNIISELVAIEGTIKSFEEGISQEVIKTLSSYLQDLVKQGYTFNITNKTYSPINNNTKLEAEHVIRVAKELLGEDKVSKGFLPIRASEDFAFYTQKIPGAYFFITTDGRQNAEEYKQSVHQECYDFNDDIIDLAAKLWYNLALDRLLS